MSGNPLEEIPDSKVIFGVEGGETGIEGPVGGTYSLTVFGESERDFHIDVGYADADHTEAHDLWGYCSGGQISFQVTVSAAADPRIRILPPAIKPEGVQADPYPSDAITCTSLSWLENTQEGVTSYNIYSAGDTDPYFTKIATLPYGTTCLEITDLWAGDDAVPIKTYAVTAVRGDGSESFFSERAQNNDRDHDGLTDAEEVEYCSDINNSDTDCDALIDGEEFNYGTNPLLTDTDGDGFSDYKEIQAGSDPIEASSYPAVTMYLKKGFNLIAIPSEVKFVSDIKDWLPMLGYSTEIEKVMVYDGEAGKFITLVPDDAANPSFILQGSEGLIVYAKQDKEITFTSLCGDRFYEYGFNGGF